MLLVWGPNPAKWRARTVRALLLDALPRRRAPRPQAPPGRAGRRGPLGPAGRKRPITPSGKPASSTDSATWSPLAAVDAAGARGDGLGFVLNGDGIACIDIDHCVRPDGSLEPWAARLVRRVPKTWIEVSPSGTGLHVWGIATVGTGRHVKLPGGGQVEVYDRGRYITVTRAPYRKSPRTLADLTDVVDELLAS